MIQVAMTPPDQPIPTGCLKFYASGAASIPKWPYSRLAREQEQRLADYLNWAPIPWLPSSPIIGSQISFGRRSRTLHSQWSTQHLKKLWCPRLASIWVLAPPRSTGWTRTWRWPRWPSYSGQAVGGRWSGTYSETNAAPILSTKRRSFFSRAP